MLPAIQRGAVQKVYVPATKNNVKTAYGKQLDYKGSYVNYYVANGIVLVPNYGDVNDGVANKIIQKQYPDRKVIGIDVRNLYENGGMVHCVTQQQPAGNTVKQKQKQQRLKVQMKSMKMKNDVKCEVRIRSMKLEFGY